MIMNRLMVDEPPQSSLSHHDSSKDDDRRPEIVHSSDLLKGRRELWIEHGDEMYRLRLTRAGKLYLTK